MMGKDAGFTLLEVMIGLAVLAGTVFTVIAGLNYHLGVASHNRDLVVAATLGREKAEEAGLGAVPEQAGGVFEGPHKKFSWKLDRSDTEVPSLKRIGINVSWDSGKSVDFISYRQTGK